MVVDSIIFDLDGTLVNTDGISKFRENKQWKTCVDNFHRCSLYPGISEFLEYTQSRAINIGIVTNSVSYYSASILQHFSIAYNFLVSYHDTCRHKPDPDPIEKCIFNLKCNSRKHVIGIGDSVSDMNAYQSSGIIAIGAGWNINYEKSKQWNHIFSDPLHIISLID